MKCLEDLTAPWPYQSLGECCCPEGCCSQRLCCFSWERGWAGDRVPQQPCPGSSTASSSACPLQLHCSSTAAPLPARLPDPLQLHCQLHCSSTAPPLPASLQLHCSFTSSSTSSSSAAPGHPSPAALLTWGSPNTENCLHAHGFFPKVSLTLCLTDIFYI